MNKVQAAASLLTLVVVLVCTWMVGNMSDKMDTMEPRLAGQRIEVDGVTTERWMDGNEPESIEAWNRRIQDGIRAKGDL